MEKLHLVHSVWNQYAPNVIHAILSSNQRYYSIKLSDGTTRLLDLLLAMTDCQKFTELLQNLADVNTTVPLDSPFWPGCTILHLAVYMSENTKLWDEFFIKSDSKERLDLLLQVHKSSVDKMKYKRRIHICLEKGCSVTMKNAEGLTPIHLAFKLHETEIINLLLNKCNINCDYSSDLSFLHIACAAENLDVVKRLLDKGADINSRTKANFKWNFKEVPVNSTILHIATIFQNEAIVKLLLTMGADVYAKNTLGMTPIHISLFFDKSIAQLFLKKAPVLRESVSNSGLSHLHVAAYVDDANAIEKLLQMGAHINPVYKFTKSGLLELPCSAIYANHTPLHVAIECQCKNAITTLMKNGADIFKKCSDGGTPLQKLLLIIDDPEVKDCIENELKPDQRFQEAIDANRMTLLHVACYMFDYEWAEKLLKEGAKVDAKIKGDSTNTVENWTGCTPMHLLIYRIFLNVNGDRRKMNDFVKLLIKNGANLNVSDCYNRSPLLLAHNLARETGDEDNYDISVRYGPVLLSIADLLLRSQSSYKVNPANNDNFSHFHYACMRNQVDVVKTFLKNGIDIDHTTNIEFSNRNATNFTPLHLAVYHHSAEVACSLIERGANVNAVTRDGDTPLHIAITERLMDFHLLEMLLRHGANINAHSANSSTPIRCFFENHAITHKQFIFFLTYGASANLNDESAQGLIGLAMKNAKPSDREAIFEELIYFCDVKNAVKNNFYPIESIVSVVQSGEVTLSFYLNAIQRFINMGCRLDQQNKEGDTALHKARLYDNTIAIEALLLLGANVNIINQNNEPVLCRERELLSKRIKKLLALHVWKMKLVGLKVHELSKTSMLKIHQRYPLDQDQQQLCVDELAKLSEQSIGESVTIRDFLREWGPAMNYPTMSTIQRENIDKFFSKFDVLHQNFLQFTGLLMMQYRKALDRFKMHKIAMDLLPSVLQVELPYLCLENILKYFNNYELSYFVTGQCSGRQIYVRSPGDGEGKRKYVQVTI